MTQKVILSGASLEKSFKIELNKPLKSISELLNQGFTELSNINWKAMKFSVVVSGKKLPAVTADTQLPETDKIKIFFDSKQKDNGNWRDAQEELNEELEIIEKIVNFNNSEIKVLNVQEESFDEEFNNEFEEAED